jgi:hypothetical protein
MCLSENVRGDTQRTKDRNLSILRKNTRFQVESQKYSEDIFLASCSQLVYSGNLLGRLFGDDFCRCKR